MRWRDRRRETEIKQEEKDGEEGKDRKEIEREDRDGGGKENRNGGRKQK